MTLRSLAVNGPMTQSTMSCSGAPTPTLTRGKASVPEVRDDVLETVVSACAAAAAHAELAERERNIVGDDDDVVSGNFIEPRRLAHSLAGEVHVGLRHHQKHVRPAKFDDLRQRAEAQAVAAQIALVDQTLRGMKPMLWRVFSYCLP